MPDTTNPLTIPNSGSSNEISEVNLDAADDLETLRKKSIPVIDSIFGDLIREKGFVEELEEPDFLVTEILLRVRYTLPEGARDGFEADLITAYTEATLDNADRYAASVKAGRIIGAAIVNGLKELSGLYKQYTADPVMLFNGQFTHTAHDIYINGAGIDFNFRRIYKNQVSYPGPLGHNWDHSYNLWIRVEEDQRTVMRSTGSLREDRFTRHPVHDYWVPPDGESGVILRDGNAFVFRTESGVVHTYGHTSPRLDFVHRVSRIEDRFGNFLEFEYQGDSLSVVRINHEDRTVRYFYDSRHRITTIEDYTGRTWRYAYDDFGDLVSHTTPATDRYRSGVTTCFEYSSARFTGALQHNLARIIDSENRIYLENEYGAEIGLLSHNRVIRQRQGNGETSFEYEDVIEEFEFEYVPHLKPAHQTTVIERNGQVRRYLYNRFGNLLLKEECARVGGVPKLLQTHYRHNRDGNLVASLTPEGVMIQNIYGRERFVRNHSVTNQEDISNHDQLTRAERQGFNRLLSIVHRSRYFRIEDLNLAKGIWGDIFPDAFNAVDLDDAGKVADVITKFTFEPVFGRIVSKSDPRFTDSADPARQTAVQGEHQRYEETLTRFEYGDASADEHRFLVRTVQPATASPDGSREGEAVELYTDASGRPAYDEQGRLLQSTNARGVVETYEYFTAADGLLEGNVKSTTLDTGGLEIVVMNEVDSLGRVIAVHHPKSRLAGDQKFVSRIEFNALDQVVRMTTTSPFEFEVRNFYDRNGNLERQEQDAKDGNGVDVEQAPMVRTFCYDEEFHPVRQGVGGGEGMLVSKTCYNAAGLPELSIQPKGNISLTRYDERLFMHKEIAGAGSGEFSVSKALFDGDGRATARVDGRGDMTRVSYDALNRPVSLEDAAGNLSFRSYDKLHNLLLERIFEHRSGVYFLVARSQYEYDERGRTIRISANRLEAPLGPLAENELPGAFVESPGPGEQLTTQSFYDANGNLTKSVDALGRVSERRYDTLDRLVVETGPLGNRIEYEYDEHGNPIRRNIVELVRSPQSGNVVGQLVFAIEDDYDELDRHIARTDSLGNITRYTYDSRNNLVETTDPLGNVVQHEFDIFNRRILTRQEQTSTGLGGGLPLDPVVTRFEYDANNNQTGIVDALDRKTSFTFDALDRLTGVVRPDNSVYRYLYDQNGNVTSTIDNNGLRRDFTYDALNKNTEVEIDDTNLPAGITVGGARSERYEYDALGRVTRAANDFSDCEYRYNSLGWRLAEQRRFTTNTHPLAGSFEVTTQFNDAGAVVEKTFPGGRRIGYERDALNRLRGIRNLSKGADYPGSTANPEQHDILKTEYAGVRRSVCRNANGTRTEYAYDGAGRRIEIKHLGPAGTLLGIQYLYDGAGNVRTRQDDDHQAERFFYDSLYRFVDDRTENRTRFEPEELSPLDSLPQSPMPARQQEIDALLGALDLPVGDIRFQYDAVGNRTLETGNTGATIQYQVNELDQYPTIDGRNFTYDANGNLVSDGRRNYVYDSRNRLVEVIDALTGVLVAQYFYDAGGNRILEISDGVETHLMYSGTDLIEEYRDGLPFAQYVHDDGIDKPVQIAAEGREHWYHSDLTGSVRMLTDMTGTNVAGYRYTPFGEPIQDAATLDDVYNPCLYGGRRFDHSVGLYDFRTREYEPRTGRFVQRDSAGFADGTNPYAYVGNNPLGFRDPLGTERQEVKDGPESFSSAFDPVVHRRPGGGSWLTRGPDWFNSFMFGGKGPRALARYHSLTENQQFMKELMDRGWGCAACHITKELPPEALNPENNLPYDWAINRRGFNKWVQRSSQARFFVEMMTAIGATKELTGVYYKPGFAGGLGGPGAPGGPGGPGSGGGGNLVASPVYRYQDWDIVVVNTPNGRQAFYRSTGNRSGRPETWLPFDEITDNSLHGNYVNKWDYVTEIQGDAVPRHLDRFGTQQNLDISTELGRRNLPAGQQILRRDHRNLPDWEATRHDVNALLDFFGAKESLTYPAIRGRPTPDFQ